MDQSECKVCRQIKTRSRNGKYPNGDIKFVDENNKLWVGKTCPECNKVRSLKNMKKLRTKDA